MRRTNSKCMCYIVCWHSTKLCVILMKKHLPERCDPGIRSFHLQLQRCRHLPALRNCSQPPPARGARTAMSDAFEFATPYHMLACHAHMREGVPFLVRTTHHMAVQQPVRAPGQAQCPTCHCCRCPLMQGIGSRLRARTSLPNYTCQIVVSNNNIIIPAVSTLTALQSEHMQEGEVVTCQRPGVY